MTLNAVFAGFDRHQVSFTLSDGSKLLNLRDVVEITPLLIQHWRSDTASFQAAGTRISSIYYLLLKAWERKLDHLETSNSVPAKELLSLAEEIICCELLTVSVSALILASRPLELDGKLAMDIRSHAGEHGALRNRVIEAAESSAQNLVELLRLQRLRRRVSRWLDLILEPVAEVAVPTCPGPATLAVTQQAAQGSAKTCLIMAALRKAVPQRRIQDPYRSALLRELFSQSLQLCPSKSIFPLG